MVRRIWCSSLPAFQAGHLQIAPEQVLTPPKSTQFVVDISLQWQSKVLGGSSANMSRQSWNTMVPPISVAPTYWPVVVMVVDVIVLVSGMQYLVPTAQASISVAMNSTSLITMRCSMTRVVVVMVVDVVDVRVVEVEVWVADVDVIDVVLVAVWVTVVDVGGIRTASFSMLAVTVVWSLSARSAERSAGSGAGSGSANGSGASSFTGTSTCWEAVAATSVKAEIPRLVKAASKLLLDEIFPSRLARSAALSVYTAIWNTFCSRRVLTPRFSSSP
mmetsp:Transcript_30796/g.73447  ORF Transcript_30796/g.73447 Transcript_30796/m.73447 type:complete len:274 (-) Transcript_30796:138-959(-)